MPSITKLNKTGFQTIHTDKNEPEIRPIAGFSWQNALSLRQIGFGQPMNKCVFLDRDGVLNKDNPLYTYSVEAFEILPGVIEATRLLKAAGFRLIVVTNQSGISKGIYTKEQMDACHQYFQQMSGNSIDHFYFSPYHVSVTESLSRKPGTLMFEKAIARFSIDIATSWMVGDRGRDIVPARKLGIRTIQIGDEVEPENKADFQVESLLEAAHIIILKSN